MNNLCTEVRKFSRFLVGKFRYNHRIRNPARIGASKTPSTSVQIVTDSAPSSAPKIEAESLHFVLTSWRLRHV